VFTSRGRLTTPSSLASKAPAQTLTSLPRPRVGLTPGTTLLAPFVLVTKKEAVAVTVEATVRAEAKVAVMEAKPLLPTPHITAVASWTGPFLTPQRVDRARPDLGEQRCNLFRHSRIAGSCLPSPDYRLLPRLFGCPFVCSASALAAILPPWF
jgi:hypothetical protein